MDGPFPIKLRQRENLENKGPQEVSGSTIRKAEVGKRVDRTEVQFCRDSEGKEFPRAMPKEARAKAGETEGIVRDANKKENNNYATVLKKLI